MEMENTYVGSFEIDGKEISSRVSSWAHASHLHAGAPQSGICIKLFVFNPSLLIWLNDRSLSDGIKYSISGHKCASVRSGPLGHPGDGEFDHWDIDNIDFEFRYRKMQLHIQLTGTSLRGSGGFSRAKDDLDPLRFNISFIVENHELQKYLKLSDSIWGSFQDKLASSQALNNA